MIITDSIAELIRALIGDGYLYRGNKNCKKYQIGFVGSPKTDNDYFKKLQYLILSEWNKKVNIKVRERGLRMVFNSKEISNFLVNELKIPYGYNKCEKVEIPQKIFKKWKLAKNAIKGIFDTDGSVFVSKKPGIKKYPCIELTTTSKKLAEQVKELLVSRDFRIAKIREYQRNINSRTAYKVSLNGQENLIKWLKEIGFSNPYKYNRAVSYLKN